MSDQQTSTCFVNEVSPQLGRRRKHELLVLDRLNEPISCGVVHQREGCQSSSETDGSRIWEILAILQWKLCSNRATPLGFECVQLSLLLSFQFCFCLHRSQSPGRVLLLTQTQIFKVGAADAKHTVRIC
ncbi:hypothetical protein D3230_06260 [Leucobacter chromiireducens subsp. solipictus]|uniref:Uncharacterized protein n=1 Tax=Leucobacter chromiireducens subsp. solipictus TaxID=398235 RepID=A0ABS1SEC4_9MICO|nr:hypothetical protein [Leucobacter chromiireducens subsp. solipictus]